MLYIYIFVRFMSRTSIFILVRHLHEIQVIDLSLPSDWWMRFSKSHTCSCACTHTHTHTPTHTPPPTHTQKLTHAHTHTYTHTHTNLHTHTHTHTHRAQWIWHWAWDQIQQAVAGSNPHLETSFLPFHAYTHTRI